MAAMAESSRFLLDELYASGERGGHAAELRRYSKKQGEPGWLSRLPVRLCTLPQVRRQKLDYCMAVKAKQAAVVFRGVLPAPPGLKRITPSSVAQKLRTPEML